MSSISWYSTGFARAREMLDNRDKQDKRLYRFWVGVGETREVIFLDNFDWIYSMGEDKKIPVVPFGFCEHSLKIDGDWKNPLFVTCSKSMGKCRPCEMKFRSQYVGALTVLDVTPFKDPESGMMVVRPRKKLMVAVPTALLIIEAKKSKRGNLQGCMFSVSRHDQKHPRVGSDFEFEKSCGEDLQKEYPDIDLSPYKFSAKDAMSWYLNVFEPLSYEKVSDIFAKHDVSDGFAFRKGASGGQKNNVDANDVISY